MAKKTKVKKSVEDIKKVREIKKKPAPVNPLVILRAKISALVNSKR